MMVFEYGLLPPRVGRDVAHSQMYLAHKYRNTLIEIERGRRAAQRALLLGVPSLAAAEQDVHNADAGLMAALIAVKAARQATRSRSDTQQAREAVASAREQKKIALTSLREARRLQREDPVTNAERDRINEVAKELGKNARAHCGVYWGTYQLVENKMDASIGDLPLYDGVEPNDPKYVRWTGDGSLGVQCQGGMTVDALFSEGTRHHPPAKPAATLRKQLRFETAPDQRTGRRAGQRHLLTWCLGSSEATFQVIVHRDIPRNAIIKAAAIHLRRRGGREHWTLCITVDDAHVRRTSSSGEGSVGVDLGWRLLPDGSIRVGAWHGEDGKHGEMRVSSHWNGGMLQVEELRSVRDKAFDRARGLLGLLTPQNDVQCTGLVARRARSPVYRDLASWLSSAVDRPDWLSQQTSHLYQWRSISRLAALVQYWSAHRFDGDTEAFAWLEAWRYHDEHLWRWESNQRERSLRNRKEQYRILAAELACKYRTLVVEKFDLSSMARRPATEVPVGEAQAPRTQRQLVAPSEFRQVLINAFRMRGGVVVDVPAMETTRICSMCGVVNRWDQAAELRHTCDACGVAWDQDENASENILARGRERLGDGSDTGGARSEKSTAIPKTSRFAKAKAAKAERLAERDARNGLANSAE